MVENNCKDPLGLLGKETIVMARELLNAMGDDARIKLNGPSLNQARSMTKHVARPCETEKPVEITDLQAFLYAILRERTGLSDQRLMGEIVRWTDPASYEAFTKKYASVFEI